jgi:hypothetical protein
MSKRLVDFDYFKGYLNDLKKRLNLRKKVITNNVKEEFEEKVMNLLHLILKVENKIVYISRHSIIKVSTVFADYGMDPLFKIPHTPKPIFKRGGGTCPFCEPLYRYSSGGGGYGWVDEDSSSILAYSSSGGRGRSENSSTSMRSEDGRGYRYGGGGVSGGVSGVFAGGGGGGRPLVEQILASFSRVVGAVIKCDKDTRDLLKKIFDGLLIRILRGDVYSFSCDMKKAKNRRDDRDDDEDDEDEEGEEDDEEDDEGDELMVLAPVRRSPLRKKRHRKDVSLKIRNAMSEDDDKNNKNNEDDEDDNDNRRNEDDEDEDDNHMKRKETPFEKVNRAINAKSKSDKKRNRGNNDENNNDENKNVENNNDENKNDENNNDGKKNDENNDDSGVNNQNDDDGKSKSKSKKKNVRDSRAANDAAESAAMKNSFNEHARKQQTKNTKEKVEYNYQNTMEDIEKEQGDGARDSLNDEISRRVHS